MSIVERAAAKTALLFREYPLGLAIVAEAGRDHSQQ